MQSITIHNLDERLAARLKKRANEEGLSVNQTIKKLLAQALALPPLPAQDREKIFLDLFGTWSEADEQEFQKNINDLKKID